MTVSLNKKLSFLFEKSRISVKKIFLSIARSSKVAFGYSSLKGAIARDASFFHIKK
jgi:hypothetical protein